MPFISKGLRYNRREQKGIDMTASRSSRELISNLMFRLLPAQVFLAVINSINSIISSLFAGNFLGVDAMSAVGLYLPFNMFLSALSTMLVGGTTILSGKYIGENAQGPMRDVFSLDLILSLILSAVIIAMYVLLGVFDLTGFLTANPAVRPLFNQYLLGQAIGVLPIMLSSQLSSFLSLENQSVRTTAATLACVAACLLANLLFVYRQRLGAFGLALSTSVGMWVFLAVQAQYYLSGRSSLPVLLSVRRVRWSEIGQIARIGVPGAMGFGYQALRGLLLNQLISRYVGSTGLSAFAANDALLRFFWAIPFGMVAVSRMLFSVSVGEEDRKAISDIMRTILTRYVPLMTAVTAMIVLLAHPLTRLYYRDATAPVYRMTALGFRLLPLAMPISVFTLNYSCYGQASGKLRMVHLMSLLTGVVCIVAFSALWLPAHGMGGVCAAHVANGLVLVAVILICACRQKRGLIRTVDDLMAFPEGFGAPENEWMNLRVRDMNDVVGVSRTLQQFCLAHGIDKRHAYLAALAMEEIAAVIVQRGMTEGRKRHEADIRVTHKDDWLILRIKDDFSPFDPTQRAAMLESEDGIANIGIHMVQRIAADMQYQSILGLNALTIKICMTNREK